MKAPAEGTLRGVATFVATLGVAVATYIVIADSGGGSPVCVGGSQGCETVADSSYSHLLGVNVAVFGVLGYLVLFAAAMSRGDGARMGGFVVSLAGFGYSVYLTYIELFVIEAVCQWCVASALLMTRAVRRQRDPHGRLRGDAAVSDAEGPEQDRRRQRLLQMASAAVFLTIAVVLVLIVVSANRTSGGDAGNIEHADAVESLLSGIPQEGMTLGEPGAQAKLVEFGDLKCPVCRAFSEDVIPQVIESKVREGSARIEFRNFTIIDAESTPAGAAALAAGEQGRGWDFVELFYRNQGTETDSYVTDEFLTAIAEKAGVADIARWNRERRSRRILAEVARTTEEAERLGFDGTPSFAVEGPATRFGLEAKGFLESAGDVEAAIDAAAG